MNFEPTNLPIEDDYPKLVRNNIPDIIKNKTGILLEIKILEDDREYLKYLSKKIIEEATELEYSLGHGNMQEELADMLELINMVLKVRGWSTEDINLVQDEKRKQNGGFDKRILMIKK